MQRLPLLSGRKVVKALSKIGFKLSRRKGSHIILTKETREGKIGVVVPDHKEIDKGTLIEIIRQARLTRKEFLELI